MQNKFLILGFFAAVAVTESVLLGPTANAPAGGGKWRRKTSVSISVPHHPSKGSSGPSQLSQSLSLSNLNLKPGQTKVITQRLVVRRRPNGNPTKGKPSRGGRRRGGSRRGHNFRPNPPHIGSGHGQRGAHPSMTSNQGQRGAHPTMTSNAVGPQHGLYLLSRMPSGSRLNQHMSNGHPNGMASLHLPVIDISGITLSQHSLGAGGGAAGASLGNGQNAGHGIGASQFNQHAAHPAMNNGGANNGNVVHAYLSGHQKVIVLQGPHSTPITIAAHLGSNVNSLNNQFNGAGGAGHSAFNPSHKTNGGVSQSKIVQTTMEPGEDPPEVR